MTELASTSTTSAGPPDSTAPPLALRVGFVAALTLSGITVVTFALAFAAGTAAVPYPFSSEAIAAEWPGDYLWMYPAMLLLLLYLALVAVVHQYAPPARKVFSLLALCLASIAAAVLLIDYFVQVTVLQPSLEKGQLDGWAMLTMYNPNGLFIALEELGYLLMSLALAVLAPVFVQRNRVERALRWLFTLSFAAAVGALVAVSVASGVDRGDLFEVIVICIVWFALIVGGPLVAVVLRRGVVRSPRAVPHPEERS